MQETIESECRFIGVITSVGVCLFLVMALL